MTVSAVKSGKFRIGADMEVVRLGFGSMRLTGRGIWGPPADHAAAITTLKRVPELGMNFIDTADSYGPNVAEELIREALHPYRGVFVATKGGLARTGPDQWTPLGRPEYLIQQAYTSCARLGVQQIDLWQLHRIDPKVPRDEQFGAVKQLLDRGVIRYAGLSEVSVADIEAASKVFEVATVQNLTTWWTGAARMCWITARATGSGSSRGSPWRPGISQLPARCSTPLPGTTEQRPVRWRSPGSSSAVR